MQKTIRYSLLLLCIMLGSMLYAQKTEKKVYSLRPNENFTFRDEHRLYFTANGNSSILFTEIISGQNQSNYAIINWQASKEYDEIFYPETYLGEKTGRFHFVAQRNDMLYVNDNGTEYGPFDEVNPQGNSTYHLTQNEQGNLAFAGKKGDTWTIYINGKTYKAYNETDYRFDKFEIHYGNDGSFGFLSLNNNGKKVVNINGKEVVTADEINEFKLGEKGRFCIFAANENKVVVFTEKGQFGPWEKSGYANLDNKGNFCYTFLRNNAWYAVTNQTEYGPYDEISQYYGVKFEEDGNFWFGFKRGDAWYLNISGKEYKGGDDYGMQAFTRGSNIAYTYRNNKMQYVVVNGKTFGPYEPLAWTDNSDLYQIKFAGNGNYIFGFRENGKEYVMINGTKSEAFDNIKKPYINEKAWYSFRYGREGLYGLHINGKSYGPFQELSDTWDTIKTDMNGRFIIAGINPGSNKSTVISHAGVTEVEGTVSYLMYGLDGTVGFISTVTEVVNYVYVGGNKMGSYEQASELVIANAKNYSFFNENGLMVNGINSKLEFFLVSESGNNILTASDAEVHINGRPVDSGACFWFQYDKQSRMFFWFKLVGSDIVQVSFPAP